jgi:hypothetical protein
MTKEQNNRIMGISKADLLAMDLRMGVWQGVAMDFLKVHPGSPALPFYALRASHP